MKTYKIKLYEKELEITQNDDGTFNFPELYKGTGTALKPAHEVIWLVRKPLEESTVAEQMIKTGTGNIQIDACRVGCDDKTPFPVGEYGDSNFRNKERTDDTNKQGRFPANLILGCSCEPNTKTETVSTHSNGKGNERSVAYQIHEADCVCAELDRQSGQIASRFFYQAKVSTAERNMGFSADELDKTVKGRDEGQDAMAVPHKTRSTPRGNIHPTVKPLKLMSYLITLITPPNGIVLDPFAGSGSTLIAAKRLGFTYIGCDMSKQYIAIARKRLKAKPKPEEPTE